MHRRLKRLFSRGEQASSQVEAEVRAILGDVRRRGDRALIAATRKFDRVRLRADRLRVSDQECEAALAALPQPERTALQAAARRIAAFHRKQRQSSWHYTDRLGVGLGQQITPLERVGVYVPGGKAAYPSSVLMNIIPAKVAGVEEVVVVSPPKADGDQSGLQPGVLAAARLAGADTVFRLGGAQAIAALAYGTQTVPRVDKIVGPGNIFVATAKRLVYGQVDIDSVAGPSEILVIADSTASARYVAADMLSQAEHDEMAAPLCLTTSSRVAEAVVEALKDQLATLKRRNIAAASLRRYGAVIVARSRAEVVRLANALAPEHVETAGQEPAFVAERHPSRRRHLFGLPVHRALWRLHCRAESHPADRRDGTLLLAARRIRFSQANQYYRGIGSGPAPARSAYFASGRNGGPGSPRPGHCLSSQRRPA